MKRIIIIITVILSTNMIVHGSGKMMADIDCKGTNHKLVYDCMIKLSEMKTGNKINGAEFSVGADMPSMPGAHNVKPKLAHEMGMGMYKVNLNLNVRGMGHQVGLQKTSSRQDCEEDDFWQEGNENKARS